MSQRFTDLIRYFNPRSRGGSDFSVTSPLFIYKGFQSTLPRRERLSSSAGSEALSGISIHAPAEGATSSIQFWCQIFLFQSTLPRRERPNMDVLIVIDMQFQSTLPRRERAAWEFFLQIFQRISIHAPAEGATQTKPLVFHPVLSISIHAPAEGATLYIAYKTKVSVDFNPRSRGGSDSIKDDIYNVRDISIHAPAEGAT